jgi:hypothetical protein
MYAHRNPKLHKSKESELNCGKYKIFGENTQGMSALKLSIHNVLNTVP